MEKFKNEKRDIFNSEGKIALKSLTIERGENHSLCNSFDYIKEREIDNINLGYKFPQGIDEEIKKYVNDFYNENGSCHEKFFERFKTLPLS